MRSVNSRFWRRVAGMALIFCLAGGQSIARDKIDIVFLKNGDRVTCEIRRLEKGKLTVKTDSMGIFDIEWADIDRIISPQFFELETSYGVRYFGSIESMPDERKITVPGMLGQEDLDHMSVVFMEPLEDNFFERLRLSMDMGYSFTKTNKETQLNLGMDTQYRTRQYLGRVKYSTFVNDRESSEKSTNNDLMLSLRRSFGRRWFGNGLNSYETNDELSLELRSLIGGGAGRHLITSNRVDLSAVAGLSYSRERFFEQEGRNNMEAMFSVEFSAFKYKSPKLDLLARFVTLPSLTTSGRVRMQLDANLRYEVFNNFFVGLNYWNKYDSKPPGSPGTPDPEKLDYAITTTIGWTFNW